MQGNQLQGQFQSRSGNHGTFLLTEVGAPPSETPSQNSPAPSLADSFEPIIQEGEQILFVGNAAMGNEGGVHEYLKKALAKRNLEITADALIFADRQLQEMLIPQVGKALDVERFDKVVIISGPLDTMKTFHERNERNDKQTIVLMTWPERRPGYHATKGQFTVSVRRTAGIMRRFESQTGAVIVPVAVVFHDLTIRPPDGVSRDDFLWHADEPHQNELGTMVAAWTLYAVLTGESPVGVNFDMPPFIVGRKIRSMPEVELSPELRRDLQYRVWEIVRDWKSGQLRLE